MILCKVSRAATCCRCVLEDVVV